MTSCLLFWIMQPFQDGSTLKKKFAPMGANFFVLRVDPNKMGGKNENKSCFLRKCSHSP